MLRGCVACWGVWGGAGAGFSCNTYFLVRQPNGQYSFAVMYQLELFFSALTEMLQIGSCAFVMEEYLQ